MAAEQPERERRQPEIRLHRYEKAIAVKWPGDDRWFMAWGDLGASAEWRGNPHNPLGFDKLSPDDEWMDPIAEHHRDLSPWTEALRRDLASVQKTLDSMEDHPS